MQRRHVRVGVDGRGAAQASTSASGSAAVDSMHDDPGLSPNHENVTENFGNLKKLFSKIINFTFPGLDLAYLKKIHNN